MGSHSSWLHMGRRLNSSYVYFAGYQSKEDTPISIPVISLTVIVHIQ